MTYVLFILINFKCIYLYVYLNFMYACPQNAKEGIESTGEEIISGWEPTNLETRNRPHIL